MAGLMVDGAPGRGRIAALPLSAAAPHFPPSPGNTRASSTAGPRALPASTAPLPGSRAARGTPGSVVPARFPPPGGGGAGRR